MHSGQLIVRPFFLKCCHLSLFIALLSFKFLELDDFPEHFLGNLFPASSCQATICFLCLFPLPVWLFWSVFTGSVRIQKDPCLFFLISWAVVQFQLSFSFLLFVFHIPSADCQLLIFWSLPTQSCSFWGIIFRFTCSFLRQIFCTHPVQEDWVSHKRVTKLHLDDIFFWEREAETWRISLQFKSHYLDRIF